MAVFTCQAYCARRCDIEWIIENNNTAGTHQRTWFESRGFNFFRSDPVNMTYTIKLTVNASTSINDSELLCSVILLGSNNKHILLLSNAAMLLVATGD